MNSTTTAKHYKQSSMVVYALVLPTRAEMPSALEVSCHTIDCVHVTDGNYF